MNGQPQPTNGLIQGPRPEFLSPHAVSLPHEDEPKKKPPRRRKKLEEKIARWGSDLYGYYREFDRPYRDSITQYLQFIYDARHNLRDQGNTLDHRKQQIKGNQVSGLIDHKVAKTVQSETFYDLRPAETDATPMDSAIARALLEDHFSDERNCWDDTDEGLANYGYSAGSGYVFYDYDDELCEIVNELEDPRNVMCMPGRRFLHHPRTEIVIRRRRMSVAEGKANKHCGWVNTDLLHEELDEDATEHENRQDMAGNVDISPRGVTEDGLPIKGEFTVAYIYCRHDPFEQREQKMDGMRMLDPKDRYHFCPPGNGGCGYQMDNMGDGSDLDEWGQSCPVCGKTTMRADAEEDWSEWDRFHKGVVYIVAPSQRLYLGYKEFNTPSFPIDEFAPRPDPRRFRGGSDTARNWSYQIAHNMIVHSGVTQTRLNVDRIFAVQNSVFNEHGRAYVWDDSLHNRIGYTKNAMGLAGMRHFQGSGIGAGWNVVEGRVDGLLRQDLGSSDINTRIGDDRSRDIAVGTIQTMVAEGETSVDFGIRIWRRMKSRRAQNILSLMTENYTEDRLLRVLGPQGTMEMMGIRASQLPYLKVRATATPTLRQTDSDQLKIVMDWFQLMQQAPALGRYAAKKLNIPPEDVEQIMSELQNQATAGMGRAGAMPPGAPPGAQPGPRPSTPGMAAGIAGQPARPSPQDMVAQLLTSLKAPAA